MHAFDGAELLGWTPAALDAIERMRGWTRDAIERLELVYLADEHRVGIPIRDELLDEHGELRYAPNGKEPKMLAPSGVARTLFPPPEAIADTELDEHRTVWLTEGEPDAIRLWSLGLPAIAVPGAQNWRDPWAARLTGRRWKVVVCFDCDQAGRAGAARAAAAIVHAGGDARLVDLAPRDDGYDLTDFTRSADTPELRDQAAAALTAIADKTELYRPPASSSTGPAPEEPAGDRPWRSIPWSTFRDTSPPAHRWLIDGLLPAGVLVFVAGPPKRGKTWIGLTVALALALGRPFAGIHDVDEPRDVLYLALEGSQTGLRTRIGALARGYGADPDGDELERLHMLYRPRPFNLADLATADWLLEEAAETDAALIVVDVLRAAARFQENVADDFNRIRDHLSPLLQLERTVALLHHFGKLTDTQKERSPGERMAGTGAMYGALDVGLLLTRSEDGARRLRVDIETRDFAAPEALELVIDGDGTGKHGGFRYADTATLELAPPDEEADIGAQIVAVFADWKWRTRDELAKATGLGWRTLEPALDTALATGRIVRVDGADVGRKKGSKPYGTPEMQTSVQPGPSQPSFLDELGPDTSVPRTGGPSWTEVSGHGSSGPADQVELDEPEEPAP